MQNGQNLDTDINMVKTPDEIEKLRQAALYTQQILREIVPQIRCGVSELEIAEEIAAKMKALGLEPSFDTIVAGGENGAEPHAVPGNRKFAEGDLITIDLGCKFQGYCGDMTRTFALGQVPPFYKKMYETVKNAQIAGLLAVRDGIICKDVDAVSRKIIELEGWGPNFVHGTGHGVGREVHERPRLNASSEVVLRNNMVVTVEPGIYIKGIGGVRIEDTVVVGGENFFDFTKELMIL
ncbi:MAG: M24 family metallopeptidase [Eubacteriales bacterium]